MRIDFKLVRKGDIENKVELRSQEYLTIIALNFRVKSLNFLKF